jgi:O-antigen/teichoic acid export membrane protein
VTSSPPETDAPPAHRVARNTALRAAAEIIGKFATLALTVVMADRLGVGAVGDFAVALAVTQLYWPIAGFGLDRLMLREIAIDRAATQRLVPILNSFKLSVGLACTLAGTLGMAAARGWEQVTWLVLLLSFALVAALIGSTAQSVFMAHERNEDYFLAALPVKLFGAILGIAVLIAGGGVLLVAITTLVAAGAGIAIGWWILGRRYGQRPAGLDRHPRSWGPLLRTSGPWGLQEVFGQITFRFGIIVLYFTAGKVVTGQYRAAYQLLEATLFLPWSIAASSLPLIARGQRGVAAGDEPPLEQTTRAAVELTLALMLPIAILLGLCAHPVITTIYSDPDMAPASEFLPYLAVASVVYGVGHIAGIVALSHLPGRRTVEATALAAAFSVVAVIVLVPSQQGHGAALASLATEIVLAGLSVRLAMRAAGPHFLMGLLSTSTIAACFMVAAVLPFRDDLVVSTLVGGSVYAAVLLALEYRRQGATWALMRSMLPGSR